MSQTLTDTLLKLLERGQLKTARELLDAYRKMTGDASRSQPRMALLKLIEAGRVEWGSGGAVSLTKTQKKAELAPTS